MDTNDTHPASSRGASRYMWPGLALNVVGLIGHLLAARATPHYASAYLHHTLGFVGGVVVFSAVFGLLGWRFWKGRRDITVLIVGVLSAIFGILIYLPHAR